ncbi:MAG: hypothetical protein QXT05_02810 [Candidatus Bilamarchaeaceae archaeon]
MRGIFLFAALMLLGLGCVQQPPVEQPGIQCNDSESGPDIYHYGYVVYNSISYADTCQGTSRVAEYFCSEDELKSEVHDCPEGYVCREGACIVVPCEDSDNGNNITIKGTASKGNNTYTDYCLDNSIIEYYCANNEINSIVSPCAPSYACKDGACVAVLCEDTESGRTTTVAGTVRSDNKSYTDYCSDSKTVFEYYCTEGGQVASITIRCDLGYVCSNGTCILSAECTDSDFGQDRHTRGTVTKGAATYTDYCSDSDTVREYYCSGDNVYWNYLDCPSGYTCSDGRCIYVGPECRDSDDGQDKYEKGTVTVDGSRYTDYCTDSNTVREYYCSDSKTVSYTSLNCPSGYLCSDGRCVPAPTCTDSDGGDIYTAGYVRRDSSTYYDSCVSTTEVREYQCEGTEVKSYVYTCPTGYACSGGRCVASCYDSDGGKYQYVYGTVFVGDAGYGDRCHNTDSVIEYYCERGGMGWTILNCGDGYACSSGVCVPTCEETDRGIEPSVRGMVYYGDDVYTDSCTADNDLKEYYCDPSGQVNYIKCGCAPNCVNGTCAVCVT